MRNIATIVALLFVVATASRAEAQQPTTAETQTPANQRFEITPRGYVQFDWRGFPGWTVTPDTGRLEPDTLDVRRLRAGIDGRWRRWSFEASVDPLDDLDDTLIKDAYVQYRVSRELRLRGGQFKLPGGREYGTSAASLNFLERAAFAESIAPRRDIGGMASGEIGRSLEYRGRSLRGRRQGTTRTRRRDDCGLRHVDCDPSSRRDGLVFGWPYGHGRQRSAERIRRPHIDGIPFLRAALRGRIAHAVRRRRELASRPLARDGGNAARSEARNGQGLDLEDLPTLIGFGWSSAVTREFGRRPGANRSRLHEWDLAVRFDSLALDDDGPQTDSDSVRPRATDVRARGGRTLTTGVSWNFSRWARVLAETAADHYTEARSAPEPGKSGVYWSFGTRLQLELP